MKTIIVIVGPTGVGKTKLSVALAHKFNGEVINADSMQVYKELNIGTAKIQESDKEGIIHHLFDIKEVIDEYSVCDYQRDGRNILKGIKNDKTPIVVGGTGLYIKALLYDYDFSKVVKKIDLSNYTNEELLKRIKVLDSSIDIHVNNRKRLERKLTVLLGDKTIPDTGNKMLYDCIFIGLTTDRDQLYKIINQRVDKMISNGLLDEVKSFYDKGIRSKSIMTGIGYKELYKYFDGEITLDESIDLIKKNSRHYAKRQYTWFNNQMNVKWFDVDFNDFNKTIESVEDYIG